MSLARPDANLVAAIAQAAVPALGYLGLFGKTTGSQIQTLKTAVVPADYTFIIWAFIYVFCLLYAADQMRPSRRDDPLYRRIGWLTAAAFAANAVWSVIAQLEISLLLTGVVFVITFATILPAALAVSADPSAPAVARIATGSLAAWVTVAIFANWSVIVSNSGIDLPIDPSTSNLILLLAAAATAAAMIVLTRGDVTYALTIAWALIGLIVGNVQRGNDGVAIVSAVLLAILAGLAVGTQRRNQQMSQYRRI